MNEIEYQMEVRRLIFEHIRRRQDIYIDILNGKASVASYNAEISRYNNEALALVLKRQMAIIAEGVNKPMNTTETVELSQEETLATERADLENEISKIDGNIAGLERERQGLESDIKTDKPGMINQIVERITKGRSRLATIAKEIQSQTDLRGILAQRLHAVYQKQFERERSEAIRLYIQNQKELYNLSMEYNAKASELNHLVDKINSMYQESKSILTERLTAGLQHIEIPHACFMTPNVLPVEIQLINENMIQPEYKEGE